MRRSSPPSKVNTVSFGFYVGRDRQKRMEAADQHNEIEINFVDRGELTFRYGPHVSVIRQGQAVLYWAAIPHQVIAVAPDTRIAWLVLPLAWFLSWNLPVAFSAPLLRGEMSSLPRQIGRTGLGALLARWAEDFASPRREMKEILRLEVEAIFRRLALQGRLSGGAIPVRKPEAGRVEQMVRYMTEHAEEAITVPRIAGAARLNPEYAMRLFRREWGMTMWDFVLQQRVFRAKRLLVLGNAKVSEIAFECGFGSASRFYSAFSRYCGCSPLEFRRHLSQGSGIPERS